MTGAILAGGASRRLGGAAKHALVLGDGRTMIEWVADALRPVCERLVVSGPLDAVPFDAEIVRDRRPGLGPLGGIEAVLERGGDEQFLFCPCDVPLLGNELAAALATRSARLMSVFHVAGEEAPRPLPARIAAAALADVRGLLERGERAVHRLVAVLSAEVIEVAPDVAARRLTNINTQADYEALLAGA